MLVRLSIIAVLLLSLFGGTVSYFYFAEFKEDEDGRDKAAQLAARLQAQGEPEPDGPIEVQGYPWPFTKGSTFPDLSFTDVDGKVVKLSQFKGKPIFIEAAAMTCGASVAFSGGAKAGPFQGTAPQSGLSPLEVMAQLASNGFTLDDPRIAYVQILFYNTAMQTPTAEDLVAWRDHFKSVRQAHPLILAAPPGLPSSTTMPLVPGMYIVDRDFKVRYFHTASDADIANVIDLYRALPRLADAPPKEMPEASDELVEKVAKAFLADQEPRLPNGPELQTEKSRKDEIDKARRVAFHDAYRADAPGAEKWNEDALYCIDIASRLAISLFDTPSDDERVAAAAAAKRAIDAGCNDPILYRSFACCLNTEQKVQAVQYARQAVDAMKEGNYPAVARYRATVLLAGRLEIREKGKVPPSPELRETVDAIIPLFVESISQTGLSAYQQELLFEPILEELGSKGLLNHSLWRLHDAVVNKPGMDPWVVDVVAGLCHMEEAWRQRGGGSASTVTEEGFHGFNEHCKASAVCFASAWNRRPEIPIAARHMIKVMLSGQSVANESMRFWLVEAMKGRFDDSRSFTAMMWALRPRWFGSHDRMLVFGKECLDTKRYDTLVPYVFANAVLDVCSELPEEEKTRLFASPTIATGLANLYAGMLADPTWNDTMKRRLRTEYAIVSYLADRMDVCREQARELGGKFDPDTFKKFPVEPAAFQQALGTLL